MPVGHTAVARLSAEGDGGDAEAQRVGHLGVAAAELGGIRIQLRMLRGDLLSQIHQARVGAERHDDAFPGEP